MLLYSHETLQEKMLSWQMQVLLKLAHNRANSGIKTGVKAKSLLLASRNVPGNQVSAVPIEYAAPPKCIVNV